MYNINVKVEYNDNKSYENVCVNSKHNTSNLNIPFDQMEDLDEETKDELLFDETQ